MYLAAGTQADRAANNKILVMKCSQLHRTTHDDDEGISSLHSLSYLPPCSAVSSCLAFVGVTPILASFSVLNLKMPTITTTISTMTPSSSSRPSSTTAPSTAFAYVDPFRLAQASLALRRSLPALSRCCLIFCVSSSSSSLVSAQQARDRGDLVRHGSGAHLEPPHPHPLTRRAAHPAARTHQPRIHLQGPQDRGTPALTLPFILIV